MITKIPAEGLIYTTGDLSIQITQTPQAGILIQTRRNGQIVPHLCAQHDFTHTALRDFSELVARTPAPVLA